MVVNVPDGIHKKAKRYAKINGMSLITLITVAITEYLTARGVQV